MPTDIAQVFVVNQTAKVVAPVPITLELHDHAGTLIATVIGYYSVDNENQQASIAWPALLGTTGQAGAMTITGVGGADLPAAIQLSQWVTDVDVVVVDNAVKKAGTVGKATNGTFSLTRTDADFSSGHVDGLPNPTTFSYPIAVDAADAEASELETAVLANGFASITEMVDAVANFRDHGLVDN